MSSIVEQIFASRTSKNLLHDIFEKTINELSTIQLFYYFENETLFILSDNLGNEISSLKFNKFIITPAKLANGYEHNIKENVLSCKQKKSFSAVKNMNDFISTIPVHKNNGEMIFYISLVITNNNIEINENFLLFMEMLANIFYKNYIIKNLIDNVNSNVPSHINGKLNKSFSKREEEIIELVMSGYPDKMICKKLNISISTLRKDLQIIYNNMCASNKFEFIINYSNYKITNIYERT